MWLNTMIFKQPSPESKGIACLRCTGERYPRQLIEALKDDFYLFWFSAWAHRLDAIPYHDLIDCFVGWEDIEEQLLDSGREDYVFVRGGSETYEPHDRRFYSIGIEPDVDLVYIAKFETYKRYDVALECCRYLAERKPT